MASLAEIRGQRDKHPPRLEASEYCESVGRVYIRRSSLRGNGTGKGWRPVFASVGEHEVRGDGGRRIDSVLVSSPGLPSSLLCGTSRRQARELAGKTEMLKTFLKNYLYYRLPLSVGDAQCRWNEITETCGFWVGSADEEGRGADSDLRFSDLRSARNTVRGWVSTLVAVPTRWVCALRDNGRLMLCCRYGAKVDIWATGKTCDV